jgi:hypothetical protein
MPPLAHTPLACSGEGQAAGNGRHAFPFSIPIITHQQKNFEGRNCSSAAEIFVKFFVSAYRRVFGLRVSGPYLGWRGCWDAPFCQSFS